MSSSRSRAGAGAFCLAPRGTRWTSSWAWHVTTAAGEPAELSTLQESVRRAVTWELAHGRHRLTLEGLAELVGARHRASVWHALRRLRSLNLVGYGPPARGRLGHFRIWIPSAVSARRAAAIRAARWPTRAGSDPLGRNVVTPTAFGGFLSREGIDRAWRARSAALGGRPPSTAPPPGGWRRDPRPLRARGRPFPPAYVDEPCPSRGHRVRLTLTRSLVDPPGDTAAVWSGRCRRDRRALAVGLVLVADPAGKAELVGDVAARLPFPPVVDGRYATAGPSAAAAPPSTTAGDPDVVSRRRQLAALFVADGKLDPRLVDGLAVDHLGYRRRPLEHPDPRPPFVSEPGTIAGVDDVAELAWRQAIADLELVRGSRRLDPPRHDT